MNSNNPFFKNKSFTNTSRYSTYNVNESQTTAINYNNTMTIQGTINKSFLMLLLLVAGAAVTWTMTFSGYNPLVLTVGGAILGFVAVLITSFRPQYSSYLAPGYAIFKGLFIGGFSAILEARYPGLVIQAVSATFVTFLVCFGLYKYNVVQVTDRFRSVVVAATLAIFSFYLITWLLSLFINFQPIHQGNSLMSIGISAFVIVIAALNLFLDFDQIEKGAQRSLPKYMEWFGAMGLMITLIWLYIEFLRLLAKMRD